MNVTAPGATGINDVQLPIGNKLMGILLYTTSVPTTAHTYGIAEARVLVDNKEFGYVSSHACALVGDTIHHINTMPRIIAATGEIIMKHYMYLDYDPQGNSEFLLETAGASSVKVRLDMDVDEAAKVIPLELVEV